MDKLTKNIGFGMGLEFRDSSLVLNAKNTHTVKSSMVFNVCVAISGLENPAASSEKGRTYALQVRQGVKGGGCPSMVGVLVPPQVHGSMGNEQCVQGKAVQRQQLTS